MMEQINFTKLEVTLWDTFINSSLPKQKNSNCTFTLQGELILLRMFVVFIYISSLPADLTVSKRPGTSYRIKIHFAVFNHLYLLFSFMKLVETL